MLDIVSKSSKTCEEKNKQETLDQSNHSKAPNFQLKLDQDKIFENMKTKNRTPLTKLNKEIVQDRKQTMKSPHRRCPLELDEFDLERRREIMGLKTGSAGERSWVREARDRTNRRWSGAIRRRWFQRSERIQGIQAHGRGSR